MCESTCNIEPKFKTMQVIVADYHAKTQRVNSRTYIPLLS